MDLVIITVGATYGKTIKELKRNPGQGFNS
jgi:hypothetical protein